VRPRVSSPKHWTDFCEILVTLYGVLSFDPHALTTTIGSHETTTKCYNCSQERFVMKVYEVMYFTLFHIYFKDMQNSQFLRNIRLSNLWFYSLISVVHSIKHNSSDSVLCTKVTNHIKILVYPALRMLHLYLYTQDHLESFFGVEFGQ
jgi:hypothetical protein